MINLEEPRNESLEDIIKNLKEGNYLIPDFQRAYDWNANDIKELLISIFSDYYIGNLLLWNTNEDNIRNLNCKDIECFVSNKNKQTNASTIVLDGQQRLTSLYYAIFNPNKTPLNGKKNHVEFFININEFIEENYDKAIYYEWRKAKLEKLNDIKYLVKNNICPFKFFPTIMIYGNQYTVEYLKVYGDVATNNLVNKLKDIINNYQIPIIELKRDIDIAKVCDIFEKINSKGIKLSTFDLLNSILRQHEIQLRTDLWEKASQKLDFIDERHKIYILQNMSMVEQNYCSAKYLYYLVPKVKKIIRDENNKNKEITIFQTKEEFINKWNFSIESLIQAEKELKDYSYKGFGILKKERIPYISMLPIYAAISQFLNSNKDLATSINRKKVKKWWYYSIFENNYSSSVESTMAIDYQNLKKWFRNQDNDIEKSIDKYIEDFSLDLSNEKNGTAIYNAILNLIITNGATDFYQDSSLSVYDLNDHHIIPKAFCEKQKIEGKYINSILNRTLIYDKTNNDIKDKAPYIYIENIRGKYNSNEEMEKMFEKHFISKEALDILKRENFSSSDFEAFIKEREKTILNYIKINIFEI